MQLWQRRWCSWSCNRRRACAQPPCNRVRVCRLIRWLQHRLPDTKLAVAALIPNDAASVDEYNAELEAVANARGVLFFNCSSGARPPQHVRLAGWLAPLAPPPAAAAADADAHGPVPAGCPAAGLDPSNEDQYVDGTHLTREGQRMWLGCMRDAVDELLL